MHEQGESLADAQHPAATGSAASASASARERHEAARLAALLGTGLLDGPPEPQLDRISRLVQRLLRAPVAMLTLIDRDRQVFASHCGLPEPWASTRQAPLSHSFCRHVVATGRPLVVPDARRHPLLSTNPAIEAPGIRAYLGVPLTTPQGHHLGALCAWDHAPRAWCDDDLATLLDLAATVMTAIECRAASERAREHQRWFRAIFDRTFQLMGLLAPDGTLLEANRTALEFVGARRDEVVGLPFPETPWWSGNPEGQARITEAIRRAADGEFIRFETEHNGGDGSTIAVDFSLTPVRDEPDGPVVLLIPEGRDITERKRAETALRNREELLQLATEVAGLGIWDWDLASGHLEWSGELHRIAGLPPGQFGGTFEALEALVHPDDCEAVRTAYDQALTDPAGFRSEHRFLLPDGTVRWIDARGRALFDDATGTATRMIGVCLDVTERRSHEQQEHDRAEALADIDRRKDEFLAMLGHELRNPLAPITHAIEMLGLSDSDPGLRRRMHALIDQQVRILTQLVDDLLEMSRINRGKIRLRLTDVNLAEVVWRAVATTDSLVRERGHRLTLDLPPEPVHLHADPLRLEQVLVNLLTNAAKYTEPGGRIGVAAALAPDGQTVALRVTDTGMGIEPAMLPKLFDLFIQSERSLDRSEGGLGIGLTLVRQLVRLHGGTVEARSDGPGLGSEFVVRLPIVKGPDPVPAEPVAPPAPAQPALAGGAPLRVLVVDDNRPAAESLLLILERWGHTASACHDGAEALAAIAAFQPDVVLLDIGLPGLDGYGVARALHERGAPRVPLLVAVTGYGADADLERAAQAGIDHHFLKPIDLAALRRLLDRQPARRPSG